MNLKPSRAIHPGFPKLLTEGGRQIGRFCLAGKKHNNENTNNVDKLCFGDVIDTLMIGDEENHNCDSN